MPRSDIDEVLRTPTEILEGEPEHFFSKVAR